MKKVILIQLTVTIIGSILLKTLISTHGAISYLEGALLVLLNLSLLTWAWSKILSKKIIALAVSVIVFKYAIFALIIYKILTDPGTEKLWFGAGLSTLMITVCSFALFRNLEKDDVENG